MKTATIHGYVVTQNEELTAEQRENNRKWVEALRSGKYKQIKRRLHTSEGMCCLGVAEDVIGAPWGEDGATDKGVTAYRVRWSDEDEADVSPSQCAKDKFGFSEVGDGFRAQREGVTVGLGPWLSGLNDDCGFNFLQIADIVAFWAGLEVTDHAKAKGEGE